MKRKFSVTVIATLTMVLSLCTSAFAQDGNMPLEIASDILGKSVAQVEDDARNGSPVGAQLVDAGKFDLFKTVLMEKVHERTADLVNIGKISEEKAAEVEMEIEEHLSTMENNAKVNEGNPKKNDAPKTGNKFSKDGNTNGNANGNDSKLPKASINDKVSSSPSSAPSELPSASPKVSALPTESSMPTESNMPKESALPSGSPKPNEVRDGSPKRKPMPKKSAKPSEAPSQGSSSDKLFNDNGEYNPKKVKYNNPGIAASVMKMDEAQLQKAMDGGKSLYDVLKESGKLDEYKANLLQNEKDKLNSLIKNGNLSEKDGTKLYKKVAKNMEKWKGQADKI